MSDLLFFAMALICTANIDWKIKPTWNYACKWESSNIFFSTGTSSLSGSIMIPCTLFISSYFFFYIRSFSTVQRTTKNSLLKIITSIVRFQQLTGHSGSFLSSFRVDNVPNTGNFNVYMPFFSFPFSLSRQFSQNFFVRTK